MKKKNEKKTENNHFQLEISPKCMIKLNKNAKTFIQIAMVLFLEITVNSSKEEK